MQVLRRGGIQVQGKKGGVLDCFSLSFESVDIGEMAYLEENLHFFQN